MRERERERERESGEEEERRKAGERRGVEGLDFSGENN